jgi:hypothetical protein
MTSTVVRVTSLAIAILAGAPGIGRAQDIAASWLDTARPAAWNTPGLAIPAAPTFAGPVDPRCKEAARPPQLEEDKRLRDEGWDLVAAYQGGWQMLVIQGTAGYDGMCRPRQYQGFVFVRGVFVGTLAPRPMDSRSDGALTRVFLGGVGRLTGEYARYAASDALCCPSRTTTVDFDMAGDRAVLRPLTASTVKR